VCSSALLAKWFFKFTPGYSNFYSPLISHEQKENGNGNENEKEYNKDAPSSHKSQLVVAEPPGCVSGSTLGHATDKVVVDENTEELKTLEEKVQDDDEASRLQVVDTRAIDEDGDDGQKQDEVMEALPLRACALQWCSVLYPTCSTDGSHHDCHVDDKANEKIDQVEVKLLLVIQPTHASDVGDRDCEPDRVAFDANFGTQVSLPLLHHTCRSSEVIHEKDRLLVVRLQRCRRDGDEFQAPFLHCCSPLSATAGTSFSTAALDAAESDGFRWFAISRVYLVGLPTAVCRASAVSAVQMVEHAHGHQYTLHVHCCQHDDKTEVRVYALPASLMQTGGVDIGSFRFKPFGEVVCARRLYRPAGATHFVTHSRIVLKTDAYRAWTTTNQSKKREREDEEENDAMNLSALMPRMYGRDCVRSAICDSAKPILLQSPRFPSENILSEVILAPTLTRLQQGKKRKVHVVPPSMALLDRWHIHTITPFLELGVLSTVLYNYNSCNDNGCGWSTAEGRESLGRLVGRQLAESLAALHESGIAHLDLSHENITLSGPSTLGTDCASKVGSLSGRLETLQSLFAAGQLQCHLIDFGQAQWRNNHEVNSEINEYSKVSVESHGQGCGKPYYYAPETLQQEEGSKFDARSVDVWQLAMLLRTVCTGTNEGISPLVPGNRRYTRDQYRQQLRDCFQTWRREEAEDKLLKGLSAGCRDLLSKMLVVDPAGRLTMDQVLAHPWLASVSSSSSLK
jgi:serine/threonine protein kinase